MFTKFSVSAAERGAEAEEVPYSAFLQNEATKALLTDFPSTQGRGIKLCLCISYDFPKNCVCRVCVNIRKYLHMGEHQKVFTFRFQDLVFCSLLICCMTVGSSTGDRDTIFGWQKAWTNDPLVQFTKAGLCVRLVQVIS